MTSRAAMSSQRNQSEDVPIFGNRTSTRTGGFTSNSVLIAVRMALVSARNDVFMADLSIDECGCCGQFRTDAIVEPLVDRHTADPQYKPPPRGRPGLNVQGVHRRVGRSSRCPHEPESQPAKHIHRN